MKRLLTVLIAAMAAVLVVAAFRLPRFQSGYGAHPIFDVRSTPVSPIAPLGGSGAPAKITPVRTFPLPKTAEGLIDGFQFDLAGRLWFRVKNEAAGDAVAVLDPSTGACTVTAAPATGVDPEVMGFALADNGFYLIVTHRPHLGSIVYVGEDGSRGATIQTGNFLPASLCVDAAGRIWALGQLFSSTSQQASYVDGQLRVYTRDGRLVSVVAGGWSAVDSGSSRLSRVGDVVSVVSPFASERVIADETGIKRFGSAFAKGANSAHGDAAEAASAGPSPPPQILSGVWRFGEDELWYGQKAVARGAYGKGHLRICSTDGLVLSPDLKLPEGYQNLAAVDGQGLLYFIYHDNTKGLQLIQARLQQ
jgi:hypothetical protein